MIRTLLQIIGLFCKRALQKRLCSAKETYDFKEPTNHSHPIHSREKVVHSREKVLHSREKVLHSREKVLHSREKVLHSREKVLHSREKVLHSRQERVHSREKVDIFDKRESTLSRHLATHFTRH